MAWPFGGLPLGGVFLGQAGGPLVQLARLGGPLLITAGVWAGGVALATLAGLARGRGSAGAGRGPRRRRSRRSRGWASSCWPWPAPSRPTAVPPVRSLRVALVQGGGQRGLSKEQVPPASVYGAQLAATFRRHRPSGPAPGLVLWPEDVVALDRPLAGSPQAALAEPAGRRTPHDARRRRDRAGVADHLPQRESSPGDPTAGSSASSRRCTGCPSASTCPLRSFFAHFADLSGRADRRRPGPRHRPDAHPGRAPRAPGLLRGLLRRAQPRLGPGRGRAADRPHQHVVVRHVAGARAGDRGGHGPGRRDRARPRAGRPDRLQRGGHPAWRRRRSAARSGGARCCRRHRRPAPRASRPTTTGATCPVLVLAAAGAASAAGWAPRSCDPTGGLLVVAGVDVDAGDAGRHVHGVVRRVVLEGQPQVEAVGPQVLARPTA